MEEKTKGQPKGSRGTPITILAVLLLLSSVGAISTAFWFAEGGDYAPDTRLFSMGAISSLCVCVVFTIANLFARWFRWHFLLRRFSRQILTRDSLLVFAATLPAIATPFYLGELLRISLLRRKLTSSTSLLFRIWIAERLLDAAVLATFYWLAQSGGLMPVAVLLAFSYLLFRIAFYGQPHQVSLLAICVALPATLFAWSLPVFALLLTLNFVGAQASTLSLSATVFSSGTLFGGIAGIPMGVSLTGSTMIRELVAAGIPDPLAILTVFVHRAGTAWFAVALGLVIFFVFRRSLAALLSDNAESHFDDIVDEYTGEIPEHVRLRLLDKKARYIQAALKRAEVADHGLDLGCGQGWYAAELTKRGLKVDGVDYSAGQLERAKAHLKKEGLQGGTFLQADARHLPFEDNSFDFSYSINAVHHIVNKNDQLKALTEVVRVLKPGGVFLLNEMNTYNPLFRFYMGYMFPLIKKIDEGNEAWILPTELPEIPGASWRSDTDFFTFLPDFIPNKVQVWLAGLESWLERSRWRKYSAHYQACLVKDSNDSNLDQDR